MKATRPGRTPQNEEVPVTRRTHHRTGVGAAIAVVVASALLVTGCAGGTTTAAPAASAASSSTGSAPADSAGATPTPTPAATDAPVVVEELGKGVQDEAVDVEVDGPVQVAFRRITIKPGAGTGKHCHDGRLIAVVEEGALTHYAPIYPEGVHV
jgi:hypothetical protein